MLVRSHHLQVRRELLLEEAFPQRVDVPTVEREPRQELP